MQIFTPSVKDGPGRLGLDVSPCPGIAVLSCMMQLLRMKLDTTKESADAHRLPSKFQFGCLQQTRFSFVAACNVQGSIALSTPRSWEPLLMQSSITSTHMQFSSQIIWFSQFFTAIFSSTAIMCDHMMCLDGIVTPPRLLDARYGTFSSQTQSVIRCFRRLSLGLFMTQQRKIDRDLHNSAHVSLLNSVNQLASDHCQYQCLQSDVHPSALRRIAARLRAGCQKQCTVDTPNNQMFNNVI